MKINSKNRKRRPGLRLMCLMALAAVCLMGSALAAESKEIVAVGSEEEFRKQLEGCDKIDRTVVLKTDITMNQSVQLEGIRRLNLAGHTLTVTGNNGFNLSMRTDFYPSELHIFNQNPETHQNIENGTGKILWKMPSVSPKAWLFQLNYGGVQLTMDHITLDADHSRYEGTTEDVWQRMIWCKADLRNPIKLTNTTVTQSVVADAVYQPCLIYVVPKASLQLELDNNSKLVQKLTQGHHAPTKEKFPAVIRNEGTVSISGSGSIISDNQGTGYSAVLYNHTGARVSDISGVTLESRCNGSGTVGMDVIVNKGTVSKITDGTFRSTAAGSRTLENHAGAEVTEIVGGTFIGGGAGSYGIYSEGTIGQISGGEFLGHSQAGQADRNFAVHNPSNPKPYTGGRVLSKSVNARGNYELIQGDTVARIKGYKGPALQDGGAYSAVQTAIDVYNRIPGEKEGVYIQLEADSVKEELTLPSDIYLDLNGSNLAPSAITGGTVHCFDSTTKNYDDTHRGRITVPQGQEAAFADYTFLPDEPNVFYLKYKESDGTLSYHRVSMAVNGYQLVFNPDPKLGHFVNFLGYIKTDATIRKAIGDGTDTKFILNGSKSSKITDKVTSGETMSFKSEMGIGGTLSDDANDRNYYGNLLGAQLQTKVGNVVMQSKLRTATFLQLMAYAYKTGGLYTGDPSQTDGSSAVDNYMKAATTGQGIKDAWGDLMKKSAGQIFP